MRRALYLVLLLLAFSAVSRTDAHAQRMGLTNLVVDNQEGRVKVRFGVDVKAVDAVNDALVSGQVLALECRAWLTRKRDYSWNAEVSRAQTLSSLRLHDGGPFEIVLPGGRQEHFRGRDLGLVMKEAWGNMSMDLGAWDSLARGNAYSLTLEIRLVRQDVSSWLKGALFFWNFDAIPPVKYQLDFSY
ncbi:DUF4390 domain-containing protein [Fundidesulfovibrio terrae]|uniref:DUF4390 domain-containing protein n=1 Tax=Fundidesulfovibrio terrae TaxID=2922866 RepID=UPI001FAECAF5|nr:DUF4390 domain-containing protein [Fundidesulfovibrio terrae]